jgi:hypothetical protein
MFKTVNQQVKLDRLAVCNTCEEFSKRFSSCKQCGCYMPAKATFAVSTCPLEKWSSAPAGQDLINKIEEMILESWNK